MKRLFLSILLLGVFFGGYCLGRRPGSPDVVGWARRNYQRASGLADTLKNMTDDGEDAVAERTGDGAAGDHRADRSQDTKTSKEPSLLARLFGKDQGEDHELKNAR